MTKDSGKNITNISYNSLNLPKELTINGTVNSYLYASDGRKLQVKQGDLTRDYVGSFVYENGDLKRVLFDGGYWESGKPYFYFNDHLGNVRVVADEAGKAVQTNDYYPFGLPMAETDDDEQDVQPYKFGGKEFDRENGLNLYDFSARQMDAGLGRFMSVDPMAENKPWLSPYNYSSNNPINRIDPNGKDDYRFLSNGKIHIVKGTLNNGKPDRLLSNNGSHIVVNDKDFLPGLSKNKSTPVEARRYSNHTSNIDDAANVFQFATENTSIEWKIEIYKEGDETTASVSTGLRLNQVVGTSQNEDKGKKQIIGIHNHPDGGDDTEASSADKNNVSNNPDSQHVIYHPSSKKIYEYNDKGIYNILPVDENNNILNI